MTTKIHMTRLIILDFDGTLADTSGVILQTMQATIHALGLDFPGEEACRATIGLPLVEIPKALFNNYTTELGERYAQTYRQLFLKFNTKDAVQLFPEVASTLRELHSRGITLAIASSRSHVSLSEFVDRFQLNELISMMIGAEDVCHAKPNPEPVLTILRELDIPANETLVVGDAQYDIEMGRAAGATTCAVTYGNGTVDSLRLANPDFIIRSFGQITHLV